MSADARLPVVYVSSNGAGLGHLTRIMAMARRATPKVEPVVVSMSQAVPVVATYGFYYEYIPSRGDLGIGSRRWNLMFRNRFTEFLERERPAAVIFDGTFPYDGLFAARQVLPEIHLIWSRRGMWQPGLGALQLARSEEFDLIVEPGDYATEFDQGATASRTDAVRVPPVTLLSRDELLDRHKAAELLGTDPDWPTALVALGAGNIDDVDSYLGQLVASLLTIDNLQVVVTRSAISRAERRLPDRVIETSVYPVSRAFKAVDLAVSAAGYNAFHELLAFGVPTAFIPNEQTGIDDQVARAAWAEAAGVGLHIEQIEDQTVARIVAVLGDPERRMEIANRCATLPPTDGAQPAQSAIEDQLSLERVGL